MSWGGGILAYSKSFANFNTHKEFNIIQGKIPNKNNGDVTLAVKLDGEKYKEEGFPSKENHKFKGYECTNGVTLTWNKDDWTATITTGKPTVCTLEFETSTRLDLNGSEPVVKEGLVPVTIADNGTVTKTETDDINWYDYGDSKWANAVILTGTDTYEVGDTIPEEAIESYFVWIPKYRYKLFNVEGNSISPQEIEIEFGTTNTIDNNTTECKATNESGNIGTCKNDMWMTHPAFTSLGVSGFWVGKFETGYKGTTTDYNITASDKVKIKPNVNSWRDINVSNMYNTSYNYKRNLDSHMMKNTEWGAMAYLTNSKYGRGNSNVWMNSNVYFVTGCGTMDLEHLNVTTECERRYGTQIDSEYGQSTTNNISGVFDTSGGGSDSLMAVARNDLQNTGFQSLPESKYYDSYTGSVSQHKILGDARAETLGWFGNSTDLAQDQYTWYVRGEDQRNISGTGIFAITHGNGVPYYTCTFRIVLSPSN